jgi:hypothetical protein
LIKAEATSSRPEAAFVLLLLQALFWAIAGISAIPFALGGERSMLGLGLASLLLALGTCLVAIAIVWRRPWARRVAIALECLSLLGAFLLLALPIGANHGLVSWLVNVGLPVAVIALLRRKL